MEPPRVWQHVEKILLEWLAPIIAALGDKDEVSGPPRHLMAKLITDTWELIFEEDINAATQAACFLGGLALFQVVEHRIIWRGLC